VTKHIYRLISLYHAIKAKNLDWHSAHQPQILAVRHERKLAEQQLAEELTLGNARLEHELEILKTRHDAELLMLKTRCKEDIKDYRQYLQALEQLKINLKANYAHLPDALIFTIHNHAKNLLNGMWEADNPAEKYQLESKFIRFMTTIHEETACSNSISTESRLPENTLKLISQENNKNHKLG
jgi:hypothetical protein